VVWDVLGQRAGVTIETGGRGRLNDTIETENSSKMRAYVSLRDPSDVGITGHQRLRRITRDMDVDVRARMHVRSTVDAFHLTVELDVRVDGLPHFNRRWVKSVTRRLL
jgi:hypothetical protein